MAARRFKVLKDFEHYPTDGDPEHPQAVEAKEGSTISNLHPDSIDGMLKTGFIEEVGASASKKAGDDE